MKKALYILIVQWAIVLSAQPEMFMNLACVHSLRVLAKQGRLPENGKSIQGQVVRSVLGGLADETDKQLHEIKNQFRLHERQRLYRSFVSEDLRGKIYIVSTLASMVGLFSTGWFAVPAVIAGMASVRSELILMNYHERMERLKEAAQFVPVVQSPFRSLFVDSLGFPVGHSSHLFPDVQETWEVHLFFSGDQPVLKILRLDH